MADDETITIAQLRDARLRLLRPLTLEIWHEAKDCAVGEDEFACFGVGRYLTEAVEDYQVCLAELYWSLKESFPKLGPGMMDDWKRIQNLIKEVPLGQSRSRQMLPEK